MLESVTARAFFPAEGVSPFWGCGCDPAFLPLYRPLMHSGYIATPTFQPTVADLHPNSISPRVAGRLALVRQGDPLSAWRKNIDENVTSRSTSELRRKDKYITHICFKRFSRTNISGTSLLKICTSFLKYLV